MGSRCEIMLEAADEPSAARAAAVAFDEIKRIEKVLSDYDPSAEAMLVMQLQAGIEHPISETLLEVLLIARDIHNTSEGAYDPSIGAITHLWRRAAEDKSVPTSNEVDHAIHRSGFDKLTVDPNRRVLTFGLQGMILDFGGIGKGYAAREAGVLLRQLGYPIFCVDIGGDIQLGDSPHDQPAGWRVEVETGVDSVRTHFLHNTSIATSGDLERYYLHNGIRYSHIIDPRSGFGLTQRRAATVISPDAALADAIASAVSVMGEQGIPQLKQAYPEVSITLVSLPFEGE